MLGFIAVIFMLTACNHSMKTFRLYYLYIYYLLHSRLKHTHFTPCVIKTLALSSSITRQCVRFRCYESILQRRTYKYILTEDEKASQIRGGVPNPSWKASCMNFEGRTFAFSQTNPRNSWFGSTLWQENENYFHPKTQKETLFFSLIYLKRAITMHIYLKHQTYPVACINSNRSTRAKVPTFYNPMHILLHLSNSQRRIGSARLQSSQRLHFQVLPLELLSILGSHQHLAYQNSLLRVSTHWWVTLLNLLLYHILPLHSLSRFARPV